MNNPDILEYLEDAYSFLMDPAIGKAIDEIKRLQEEIKRRPIVYCFTSEAADAVLKSHDRDKEIERLREALRPFAKLAEALVDNKVNYAIGLTDDHFDAARKALGEKE